MSTQTQKDPWLIIGYGSTLRGDDAAGPVAAELIEARHLPGVRVIVSHQLTPELADPVSKAQTVVFIDAAIDLPDHQIRLRRLEPDAPRQLMAHVTSPGGLLHLSESVFNARPVAWMVEIPANEMGISESLSDATAEAVKQAAERVVDLISSTR